jgi:hypothetical protein
MVGARRHSNNERELIMRKTVIALFAGTAVLSGIVVTAPPAFAAAPANDDFAARTSLTLGSPVAFDSSEATSEDLDTEAAQSCPFPPGPPPAADNTIWYEWDAGSSPPAQVAVTLSVAVPTGVAVVTGEPGSFVGVACGGGLAQFSPVGGESYRVMLFDFSGFGGGPGQLTIGEPPAPPSITATVDPFGYVDGKTGSATVTGTYRCANATFAFVEGALEQRAGRLLLRGFLVADEPLMCDGTDRRWSATVVESNGLFTGGKAVVEASVFACGFQACTSEFFSQELKLRGARN